MTPPRDSAPGVNVNHIYIPRPVRVTCQGPQSFTEWDSSGFLGKPLRVP